MRNSWQSPLSVAGLFFVFVVFSCFAAEESITVTTYYPSPYGVYSEMRLYPKAPPPPLSCSGSNEGTMYYDNLEHTMKVCRCTNAPTCVTSTDFGWVAATNYWTLTGTYLYPNSNTWNVGIGTTNPGSSLTVHKPAISNVINVRSDSSTYYTALGITPQNTDTWYIYTDRNTDLWIGKSLSTTAGLVTIKDTGNVGIGTTNPGTKLSVRVNGDGANAVLRLSSTLSSWTAGFGPRLLFHGGSDDRVFGEIGSFLQNTGTGANAYMTFSTRNSEVLGERMRITSTGNVGIGTAIPAEKLEVSGNIKLSGASATYKITNVVNPTSAQDVATKAYVDAQASSGPGSWNCTVRSGATTWFNSDAICVSPEKAISGGCQLLSNIAYSSYPTSQGWHCDTVSTPNQIRAYTNCCK